MYKKKQPKEDRKNLPQYAPGIEMDSLELRASEEEIKEGNSTAVTKLFIDRVD